MVTWKILALFLATILPLVFTPGPDMLLVTSQALVARWRGAVLATIGICAGYLVHAALATLGLAAVIAASPALFGMVRMLGAAYLVYLGIRLFRAALRSGTARQAQPGPAIGLVRQGMLTSLLNPKGLLFFLALLPQFVHPESGDVAMQTLVLALAFVATCFAVYLAIGLAVAAARERFAGNTAERAANGISGAILMALGVRLALTR